jgi:quercetin dioxygenase-like cupin family protein
MWRRRDLLLLTAFAAVVRSHASEQSPTAATRLPAALSEKDGELVYVGRDPVRIKISPGAVTGRFGLIVQDVSPGTSIPVHRHEKEDEVILIQAGEGEAILVDERIRVSAGSTLYVPQGTWHGGRNTGTQTLKWVALYSPSGFERYFREIGRRSPEDPALDRTPEERRALDARFGIRYR